MNRDAKFELQPCLTGELLELRPLHPDDWEELFRVASDPLIWEQHPEHDRYEEHVFRAFFQGALESRGALVVLERGTRQVIGSSRYCGYDPGRSEVEIGWTFLARSYWGGRYNREMKRLMLDHAFNFVDRVIFVVGSENVRSQKALEKIGAVFAERRERIDPRGRRGEVVVYEIRKPTMSAGDFQTFITATLSVRNWAQAMDFYKAAFGARELYRVPGGGVAQLSVAGAEFWVAEESPEHLNFSPESLGGCSVRMLLIVEDPAAVCKQAVATGATQVSPVEDAHGWRIGRIVDPSGHHWEVARPLS